MKKFWMIIMSLLTVCHIHAQQCDIVCETKGFLSGDLRVGQQTDLRFDVFNDAKGGGCMYTAKSVMAVLSLPSNGLKFEAIISPVDGLGKYFTWTYNAESNALIGINHMPLGDKQGDMDVTVRLSGTLLSAYDISRSVALSIIQNPTGDIFKSNNPYNDNTRAMVTIRSPKAVDLASFSAVTASCNKIKLKWETTDEQYNDYIEVQRSVDGKNFVTVGTFKGSNLNALTPYQLTDEKGLDPGAIYTYRLNQVTIGGISEIIKEITVENLCPYKDVVLDVYPNPAFDKTFVTIKNLSEKENVILEVINIKGEQIMTIQSASVSLPNEIKLNNLPAGVYTVRIAGRDEVTSKRFIKIN
jgi:hypothetical protein